MNLNKMEIENSDNIEINNSDNIEMNNSDNIEMKNSTPNTPKLPSNSFQDIKTKILFKKTKLLNRHNQKMMKMH